jgi:hypothetical protein
LWHLELLLYYWKPESATPNQKETRWDSAREILVDQRLRSYIRKRQVEIECWLLSTLSATTKNRIGKLLIWDA